MTDAVVDAQDGPHGTNLLQRDLTDEDFAAATILASLDDLVIDDLTDAEYESFIAALSS